MVGDGQPHHRHNHQHQKGLWKRQILPRPVQATLQLWRRSPLALGRWGGGGEELGVGCGSLGLPAQPPTPPHRLCCCNLDSCLLSCAPFPPSQRNHTPPSSWKQVQIPLLGNSAPASGLLLEGAPSRWLDSAPLPPPLPHGQKELSWGEGLLCMGSAGSEPHLVRVASTVFACGMNKFPKKQPISPHLFSHPRGCGKLAPGTPPGLPPRKAQGLLQASPHINVLEPGVDFRAGCGALHTPGGQGETITHPKSFLQTHDPTSPLQRPVLCHLP